MKKIWLLGFVMVLLAGFVSADNLTSKLNASYDFEGVITDGFGSFDLSNSGGTYNSSVYMGGSQSMSCFDNNDVLTQSTLFDNTRSGFSISVWVWMNTDTSGTSRNYLFEKTNNAGLDIIDGMIYDESDNGNFRTRGNGNEYSHSYSGQGKNHWFHLVYSWDSSGQVSLWSNGTQIINSAGNDYWSNGASGNFKICNRGGGDRGLDGTIDAFYVFGEVLNSSQVEQLYAGGSGCFFGDYCFDGLETPIPYLNTISASISPNDADATTDLYGAGSINGSGSIKAYWKWYVDGVVNVSGVNNTLNENILTNISIIDNSITNVGETWIFSVIASNSTSNSTWINSSSVTIESAKPNPIIISPSDGFASNTLANIYFNITHTDGLSSNCTLFLNGVENITSDNVASGSFAWLNTTGMVQGDNWFYINCSDGAGWGVSDNNTYWYDLIAPVWNTNFINNTLYEYGENIISQFNFSDNLLFWTFNISVNGVSYNSSTGINTSTFNTTTNITSYNVGVNKLNVRGADGHTAEELERNWKFNNGLFNDYTKYTIDDKLEIKTERKDKDWRDEWESLYKKDRYIQIYRPHKPSKVITFVEESNFPISIVHKPGHYNDYWIIIGGVWKDYVLTNQKNAVISIERINDYKVEVTVTNDEMMDELHFQSIGELNTVTKTYTFNVYNGSVVVPSYAVEVLPQTHLLNVSHSSTASVDANFSFNGTQYTITKQSNPSHTLFNATFYTPIITKTWIENTTYLWNWNITDTNTTYDSLGGNVIVYKADIDDCSNYTTKALNLSIVETSNNTALVGAIDTQFIISGGGGVSKAKNLTYDNGNSTYTTCIYPSFANYTMSGTGEATVLGRPASKTVTYTNTALDNESLETSYYFFNINEQRVILEVIDQDDEPVNGVSISVQEYDIVTGSYNVTDTVTTGTNGVAITTLILYDTWYRFVLTLNGEVIKTEGAMRVISTTNTIRVLLQDDYMSGFYNDFRKVSCDLSYDNNTLTYSLDYDNTASGSVRACVYVTERSVLGDDLINQSCETANSGIIPVSFSNPGTNTYIGVASITINNETQVCDTYEQDFNTGFNVWGLSALLQVALLLIFITTVGIFSPTIAIVLNTIIIVLVTIPQVGLFHLTGTSIAIYIILAIIAVSKTK